MKMRKRGTALEGRYGDWFNAFSAHSNENERQGALVALLFQRLKERASDAFVANENSRSVFVDLMCGPGAMTRCYKSTLERIGVVPIKACGIDLRADHVKQWKLRMDEGDRIVQGNVADRNLDIATKLGLADKEDVVAVFWGHGGYYLYKLKSEEEKGCNEELSDQPELASVVSRMHQLLSPTGISVSIHKSTEWTDIVKQQFSRLVESHTTGALQRIYKKQGIVHCSMTIECGLRFPVITEEIRSGLVARDLVEYEAMDSGPGKSMRQILEFLVHTKLEDLAPPKLLCGIHRDSNWRKRNREARLRYVQCIEELVDRHEGVVPTYVNFLVSVSPRAPRKFAETVVSTVRELDRQVGREIDMAEFLGAVQRVGRWMPHPWHRHESAGPFPGALR